MYGKVLFITSLLLIVTMVGGGGHTARSEGVTDPGSPGPCDVSSQTVFVNGSLETHVYHPSDKQCGDDVRAPYPAVAFAHGFSMFGLSNGASENRGNGGHLASWGYIVAIPVLPDDAGGRITDLGDLLSYLETQANRPGSFLYQKLDRDRLAVAGYSLGGATALALAARDSRPKAVVALDPVYHEGAFGQEGDEIWHPDVEGPDITVPTAILGASPSSCNAQADYTDIYPVLGATHKASFLILDTSHCDFADPGNSFCGVVCGAADHAKTQLSQKYMTAWFNYYLHRNTDYYTYLYGTEADADISAGLIERQMATSPRGVVASGGIRAVYLAWRLYEHPTVASYNIYRRLPAENYPNLPNVQVGRRSSYLDTGLAGEQTYHYRLCSRDPAGNLHQLSNEVSAISWASGERTFLPLILKYAQ